MKQHIERLESRQLFNLAPFGVEWNVKSEGSHSDVAVAGNGAYFVATSSEIGVEVFRYDVWGRQLGRALHVSSAADSEVSISADADGDAVVAYRPVSADGKITSVYFKQISRTGVMGKAVHVASVTKPDDPDSDLAVAMPQVSMDDSGRFFVGWFEGELQWDQYLHFRAYNGDGSPRADEFSTSATYLGLQFLSNFDLSVTPDGNSAAYSIESNHSDSHGYDVFFGRVSSTGVLDLATTHTVPGAAVVSGRITSFADGSFAIAADEVPGGLAWNWEVTTSDFTSFVQRFDAAGNPIGEHILLGATLSEGGAGAMNPTIYRLAGGGFVAAYTQGRTLYAQRFNANGLSDDAGPVDFATLDRDVEVNNEAPQIAISASPSGSMIVSFTAADGDWSTRDAIHTRRLTTDAGAIDKSTLYVLGTRRSDAMSVKPRGASVFANVNSASVKFPLSQFFRLEFEGFNGNDRIYNETSIPSTIRGGSGDDELQGGSGSDLIRGNVGDDDLSGNEGNDTLIGDDGRDLLVGNDGNDQLEGGAGADRLYGYAGNDTFFARDGEIDRIFRLTGRDTVDGDAGDVVK